ncbi:fimbrial protein [Pseudomonas sp. HLT2-19-2]
MDFRKTMLAAVVLTVGTMSLAHAAVKDQGHGKVTFKGSINEAPCSISPDTVDQTVDLGMVSNKALADGGKSKPQNFQLKLESCDLGTLKTVTATFSGSQSAGNPDLLGITGSASGASVAITDGNGQLIKLGEPSTARGIQGGDNTMQFSAYLQGDPAPKTEGGVAPKVVPGEFTSVADFTLAYQ